MYIIIPVFTAFLYSLVMAGIVGGALWRVTERKMISPMFAIAGPVATLGGVLLGALIGVVVFFGDLIGAGILAGVFGFFGAVAAVIFVHGILPVDKPGQPKGEEEVTEAPRRRAPLATGRPARAGL